MRNNVQLFIGGKRADLDDGSFILFTYTAEELTNPTIVRNSFSRQITLKGTPTNDEIFGHIYRNDRLTQYGGGATGPDFDPTRKTPFTIYNSLGEILEDGYLKLNKVVRKGRTKEYAVTLYGGLGSFLYGLAYDNAGNKRTLSGLDYGETLDFTINRTAVADAWARIGGDTSKAAKWDIINFAPAYAGLPPSPFDANKGIVTTWKLREYGMKTQDGDYRAYTTLVTLNDKVTGMEAKDLRSYLQKPVLKMSALINAICDPANNGGWTVNKDADFFKSVNPYWEKAWLTLPNLNELNVDEAAVETSQSIDTEYTHHQIIGGGSGLFVLSIDATPTINATGLANLGYVLYCRNAYGTVVTFLTFTFTLYDSSDNVISTAKYYITSEGATIYNGMPTPSYTFHHIDIYDGFVDADGNPVVFPFSVQGEDAAYYSYAWGAESYFHGGSGYNPGDLGSVMWEPGETVFTDYFTCDPQLTGTINVSAESSSSVRTGAVITKSVLLGGGGTPADYLLSYCKMFGLFLVKRKGEKTIDIVARNNFYKSGVTDLGGRIDRGKEIEKAPFSFDARWYLFGNAAKGEYAENYASRYGRDYGQYRVNTGYEFDAEEKNVTAGIIFGGLVPVLDASPYFCELQVGNDNVPSVFLCGGQYLLWNGSETTSLDLPSLAGARKTWDNPSHPMLGAFDLLQLHGDNKGDLTERDTLVFFSKMEDTSAFSLSLTDDDETMLSLNGNTPCWLPGWCGLHPEDKVDVMPKFSRYDIGGSQVDYSMDFGDPLEVRIPGITFHAYSGIFARFWRAYIEDRYDDDSAVVTAYVDLRGMQVGHDMLRQFYAFDGAVWSLNRIIDHSLTTYGPTKCEFVKVQDTIHYTSGQII